MMTYDQDTLEALALLQLEGVGPATARKVLSAGGLLSAVLGRLQNPRSETEWQSAKTEAGEILERSRELSIHVIGINTTLYPPLLRQIPDPPVVIYVKGDVHLLHKKGIAVVGTRKVSVSGTRLTQLVSGFVAKRGYTVVSGLALGVDALAHEAALEASGLTVAVLAHGLDTVSPASNRKLAERILLSGGVLMSEHPPGFPARPAEFVRRNRLQSGLSLGSIVVESGVEGGSMHQARFTKAQGRRLMTVLASSDETRGDLNECGARELISSLGAIPLKTLSDVGRELDALKLPEIGRKKEGDLF